MPDRMSEKTPKNHLSSKPNFWDSNWGAVSTLLLGFLVFILFSIFQSIFLVVYVLIINDWNIDTDSLQSLVQKLAYNGDAISFAEVPAAFLGIITVLLFTSLQKPVNIIHYLQLAQPSSKELFKWLGIMILVIIFMEFSYILFERNTPDFMTKVYQSTANFPLLWFAVIIAAPFFEEFLFRGYLLEGIRRTKLGDVAAVVITSFTWAVIHMQYEIFEISIIFLIGIVMAVAKLKTQSLYIPIAMHMMMNLTASVMMELQ